MVDPNKLLVRKPDLGAGGAIVRVERAPSVTQAQGFGDLMWLAAGGAQGSMSPLKDVGRWNSGDLALAREVRVTFVPSRPPVPPANYGQPPLPGAMALITYQGQNGVQIKRWVACPADLVITATQIRVQALAVGLPYQAFPQNCQLNAGAAESFQVSVTFSEQEGEAWPSVPLYPASFNNGAVDVGASLGGGAALGIQGLIYTQAAQGFAASGFLRSLQITNGSASVAYMCLIDAPSVFTGITAQDAVSWSSCAPIAVPIGTTVLRAFDDLPFFWGPWVAAVSALSSPGFLDATNIFVQADYAPVVTPGA